MSRTRPLAAAIGLVLVLLGVLGPCVAADATTATGGPRRPRRVLVVTAPHLTWNDVQRVRPRHMLDFLDRAAMASNSVRTAGSTTRSLQGYLTLGAGNRVSASTAASIDFSELPDPVGEAGYLRTMGRPVEAPIFALGLPAVLRGNDLADFGAVPGSLADALRGRTDVAAIGNAARAREETNRRDVALAAMDESGQVTAGMVNDELIRDDPHAPWGLTLDPGPTVAAVRNAWSGVRVAFVELSDLARAEAARADSLPDEADRQFDAALRRSDALFEQLLATVDLRRDLVILLAPDPPLVDQQLTVLAMAGPGVSAGWATSSTTRRPRFVALTDVAPTIVDAFGLAVPREMTDVRITSIADDTPAPERVAELVDDGQRALNRDRVFGPFTVAFVVGLVIVLILATLSQARFSGLAPVVRLGASWVMAVLPLSFLAGLLPLGTISPAAHGLIVGFGGLLVAAALEWVDGTVGRRMHLPSPPLTLAALTVIVLGVDILTGGWLQLSTIFGYSPIVAGRFAGFGNQAFSALAISSLLVGTASVEPWLHHREADRDGADASRNRRLSRRVLSLLAVAFLIIVVLDGAPSFGSDVGGVLALVPSALVALLLLAGVRIRWRTIFGMAVLSIGVLTAFALLDLTRDPSQRTHLGRFAQQLLDGQGLLIIQRKLSANIRVLSAVWTWVIPAALVYIVYLSWRPNERLAAIQRAHPAYRAFGISALVLGFLSMALNDSGVSMPALMLAVALSYTTYLAMTLVDAPVPSGGPDRVGFDRVAGDGP